MEFSELSPWLYPITDRELKRWGLFQNENWYIWFMIIFNLTAHFCIQNIPEFPPTAFQSNPCRQNPFSLIPPMFLQFLVLIQTVFSCHRNARFDYVQTEFIFFWYLVCECYLFEIIQKDWMDERVFRQVIVHSKIYCFEHCRK